MTICSGDSPRESSQEKRIAKSVEVCSPQFLPDTIEGLARARMHLSKGRIAVCAELITLTETKLKLYERVVARRFLHSGR